MAGGLVIAALASGSIFFNANKSVLTVCEQPTNCRELNQKEYDELKHYFAAKLDKGEPLDPKEYPVFIAVSDKAVKEKGGFKTGGVTSTAELLQRINNLLGQ